MLYSGSHSWIHLSIGILVLITGCSYFSDYRTLTVQLPLKVSPWEKEGFISEYLIVFPGGSDPNTLTSLYMKPGEETITIRIRKGPSVPVAVYPDGMLKPLGGIFPFDLTDRSTLMLSGEKGFIADILLDLAAEHERIEAVNIERLDVLIREKSNGDPWSIDPEVLKNSLILGSISEYKIKKMELQDINISNMQGTWIPDDPFMREWNSDSGGNLIMQLYPGISCLLNRETKHILYISVGTGGYEYIVIE